MKLALPTRLSQLFSSEADPAPLSVLRNLPIVVDDPVARQRSIGAVTSATIAPREADSIGRPERPSSIVAPNQNLPTTIREKEKLAPHRPGGPSRSNSIALPSLARV